jgi:hypothetical protein
VAKDDKRVAESGATCISPFVELWCQLLTELDRERIRGWQTALLAEARALGAAPVSLGAAGRLASEQTL